MIGIKVLNSKRNKLECFYVFSMFSLLEQKVASRGAKTVGLTTVSQKILGIITLDMTNHNATFSIKALVIL